MKELEEMRRLAVEAGLIPKPKPAKTVEVERIKIIQKEVEVETVSMQFLTEVLKSYLPTAASACLEGYANPIKLLIQIKEMGEIIELAKKMIEKLALAEAEKYSREELEEYYGLEISETGDRPDYEKDAEYARLKEALRERENLIKIAFKNKGCVDANTGEWIEPVPTKNFSTRYLKKASKRKSKTKN